MTSDADRLALLSIARAAIVAHTGGQVPSTTAPEGSLAERRGAFVTLHAHGELRGCIGHVEADEPVAVVVSRCAVLACSADSRFPPVTAGEVTALQIELSLLGPLVPVSSADEIEIGRDGLVVEERWSRGLLLPQVATEWNWDREAFLAQTCRKAGLPRDAWKRGARIWRFEAEVFGEPG
ncbi:MAG TPA: AmmeMemoRadiSam system protein A [Vicinamibacterales bacterium]|jgi:AmmeMemoRadiSam system protein A